MAWTGSEAEMVGEPSVPHSEAEDVGMISDKGSSSDWSVLLIRKEELEATVGSIADFSNSRAWCW